jgi:hypothetical protein
MEIGPKTISWKSMINANNLGTIPWTLSVACIEIFYMRCYWYQILHVWNPYLLNLFIRLNYMIYLKYGRFGIDLAWKPVPNVWSQMYLTKYFHSFSALHQEGSSCDRHADEAQKTLPESMSRALRSPPAHLVVCCHLVNADHTCSSAVT